MLRLNSLSLVQFKNYQNRSFDFNERIVGISGRNGIGKTNLLDAIHYLCFTKSYFTRLDGANSSHGQQGFRIAGQFKLWDNQEHALCVLRETGRKEFSINENYYEKFSEHIGHYPCVIIAPDDIQIITGGSEERRRLIDSMLSQTDPEYLQNLIIYNRILLQRNSLLKSFAETAFKDLALLSVLDEQLIRPGEKIFEKRKGFLISFLPAVKHLYEEISKQYENITLFYESQLLQASFSEMIKASHNRDQFAMRTTCGVHKDELAFNLNDQPFKNIASQGQRKSLLFALKLAELNFLKKEKGFAPFLLLDDVFEKLDEDRIANLLQRVCVENDGQVFITDTNKHRLEEHLKPLGTPYQLIELT